MADITVADITVAVSTVALVLVTGWYARLTKRIADAAAKTAESSEHSAQTGAKAAEAAERAAEAAEVALLAESMPFVRQSLEEVSRASSGGDTRTTYKMVVRNSGRHAALNVELFLGEDRLHTFPVIDADTSEQYKLSDNVMAERIWKGPGISNGWLLRTRYSDPYGHRYEVEERRQTPGRVAPEHHVSTYRIARDGRRKLLVGGDGS